MILAGIDEAGYGPLLGPLVVGCCAFELAEDPQDPLAALGLDGELPCVWQRLKKVCSKHRSKSGRKLHVNDSKLVYSPAGGLKELERSVLAVAAASGMAVGGFDAFLAAVAAHAEADLQGYPWYAPFAGEVFPLAQEATPVALFANGLRAEMQRTGTRCVYLAARVVPERHLNRLFEQTRNKGNALFSIAAIHLDHLLRTYGQQRLVIFCDRQGAREHYGHLLRLMFEDWALQITREADGHSEYRLVRGGHTVRLVFCEKAEAQCLPVAMASMLAKYLREALMHRFNAYWRAMLPELEPTAGYYQDGTRFLQDIDAKRRELGVRDEHLIRCR